uniref:Uncharacterized protein n=1 Tax=Anguilla anguilla TaxID=7936 RepID=A0A0E9T0H3_ANGAN
MSLRARLYYR